MVASVLGIAVAAALWWLYFDVVALGLKKTLGHVEDPLKIVPATAMLGGTALYLLAHVAFRYRNVHRLGVARLTCAAVVAALIPAAVELPA